MKMVWAVLAVCLMSGCALAGRLSGPGTINVSTYGAVPDDGKDDTLAITATLGQCKDRSSSRLVFPRGVYDITVAAGKETVFTLDGYRNLTIDGNGCLFMVHGMGGVFRLSNCTRVTIKGLAIDYAYAPFSEGRVVAVDGQHFDVEFSPDRTCFSGMGVVAYMDYEPDTRLPVQHGIDAYNTVTSTELIKPQVLRLNLTDKATIKTGKLVLLRHWVYNWDAFTINRCSDFKMEQVTIYTAPGMGVRSTVCRNLEFSQVRIVPHLGRLMSTTADGIHMIGCTGTVTVQNCEFEGLGDDAVNIYPGLYLTVLERISDDTIVGRHNLRILDPPDPGETMELVHQESLLRYGTAVVKNIELNSKDQSYRVVFTKPLPAEFKLGDVICNASRLAKIRISGCSVSANRARGFLVQGSDIEVDHCRFTNCTSGGVWVIPEVTFFYQGVGSRNVVIRDNVFNNSNYGGPIGEGVISVYAYLNNFGLPAIPGIHKNITIKNNIVNGSDNSGILVAGVEGLKITGNTLTNTARKPTWKTGGSAIYIQGSRDVQLKGNTVDKASQGAGLTGVLGLGAGVDPKTVLMR